MEPTGAEHHESSMGAQTAKTAVIASPLVAVARITRAPTQFQKFRRGIPVPGCRCSATRRA